MSTRIIGATCAAALLSFTVAAADQAAPQTPVQAPVQSSTPGASQQQPDRPVPTPAAGQITVTGCVTREVAGQFALSEAALSPAAAGAIAGSTGAASRDGATAGATGTSGSAGGASAGVGVSGSTGTAGGARTGASITTASNTTYSLAGDRENELEKHVGQRVEIVGTLDATAPGGSSAGAGGAASSDPGAADDRDSAPVTKPEGSADRGDANRGAAAASGHAQRLNIVSFRAIGGQCS